MAGVICKRFFHGQWTKDGAACSRCGYPSQSHASAMDDDTARSISDEVKRARTKFPGNRLLLAALTEEVGELAKEALLQRRPREEWIREAIQVACVAVRIIEEGDATFDNVSDEESQP